MFTLIGSLNQIFKERHFFEVRLRSLSNFFSSVKHCCFHNRLTFSEVQNANTKHVRVLCQGLACAIPLTTRFRAIEVAYYAERLLRCQIKFNGTGKNIFPCRVLKRLTPF
jgi:hypothetical protein